MSILMFSGMRTPLLLFVFTNKYCKSYIYATMSKKQPDITVKLRLTLFWPIVFFSVLIMLGWFPYSDIWADVKLSFLWMFCKT